MKSYFVDKSMILAELFPMASGRNNHICITRPRRFGKTIMANMIASFFSNACDAAEKFSKLQIAQHKNYKKHLNQYSVIHISFNYSEEDCTTYNKYISDIQKNLVSDIKDTYPDIDLGDSNSPVKVLSTFICQRPFCTIYICSG